jgi:Holliday junction resolvasome RuvABC ATP-dependent DNA helicase subunit
VNISPTARAAILARINAVKAATPITTRKDTMPPTIEPETYKPAFDDGLFATTTDGIPVTGTTPATPTERIDLELDDNLKSFLMSIGTSTGIENLRLIGPAGCGKTSIGQWLAQETNKRLLIMDCSVIREPRDWFGFRTVHNGSIRWQDTEFVRAVTSGNCVIVLDELNRAPASVLNGLMPLLDHRRASWIEERGAAVRVGPNTTFVATTNMGAKYLGASPVDLALRDRFSRVVEVTYLPTAKEAMLLQRRTTLDIDSCVALAHIASNTRGKNSTHEPISTRELLAAASDIAKYGQQSLRYTILSKIEDHSKRAAMATLLAGKFPGLVSDTVTTTNTEPF